ncbi:MAG: MotA/TolQ/ExbB proton channel family protein [Bdellovibrionales bacterium]|nr:MotA/TolQ/ExbB proton channel family protein [Bdellovibrionales bacterium]
MAAAGAAQQEVPQNFILHAFEAGGPMMYVILAFLIMTLIVVFKQMMILKDSGIDKEDFNEHLFGVVLRGDVQQAISYCDSRQAPLTNTLKAGLVQVLNKRPDEEVQVAMDASVLRETPKVEGWVSFLAVFGNLATLLGLAGTIVGMITSFQGVTKADDSKKAEMLSKGIAEALNCTAFGLIVAIIAILAYGFFQFRIGHILNEMTESSMSLMNLVSSNRDKMK